MRILIILTAIFNFISFAKAQDTFNADEVFWDAETYFYEEDYKEALTLYRQLLNQGNLDNANINYRIGVCYLKAYHKASQKIKAIPYLEKAVKQTAKKYKEGSIYEIHAPYDAYIYLADAYAIANKLDKAISTYKAFKDSSKTDDKYYLDIVNRKIETCNSAKLLMSHKVKYTLKNLGPKINNRFANYNAVLSGDGKTFVYTTDMKFYEAVFYCKKNENGEFTTPKNLNIEAKVEGSIRSVGISNDGTEIYLFKPGNDYGKGDIYVTKFDGTKWSEIKKLNKNINTSDLERHAFPSKDGKTLYFTSNRKGGFGGLDIYKSTRKEDGSWGKAENLGKTINSQFDDVAPFILADNKTLYFSSQGHFYNMGNNDLFVSVLSDTGWTKPLNFGYPINTTNEDKFLFPVDNKGKAYISLATDDGYGDLDIYEITFYPDINPKTEFTANLGKENANLNVEFIDENGQKHQFKTDNNGNITAVVPSGKLTMKISGNNIDDVEKQFDIPKVYAMTQVDFSNTEIKHKQLADKENNNGGNNNDNKGNAKGKINPQLPDQAKIPVVTAPAILFGFDKYIPEKYNDELDKLADYLKAVNNILIEIQGYADAQGDETYNIMLSQKRADFVKNYLIKKGVDKNKLKTKAFGEQYPIAVDLNPQSRKYNRRVQFKIIRDEAGKLKVLLPEVPDMYKIK